VNNLNLNKFEKRRDKCTMIIATTTTNSGTKIRTRINTTLMISKINCKVELLQLINSQPSVVHLWLDHKITTINIIIVATNMIIDSHLDKQTTKIHSLILRTCKPLKAKTIRINSSSHQDQVTNKLCYNLLA
jgi:hypothetical protein